MVDSANIFKDTSIIAFILTKKSKSTNKNSVILKLQNVSKSFGTVKALDDVTLEIRAGEILSILGENGAGKSTLMKILSGLYQPDSGEVLVDRVWFEKGDQNGNLEVVKMDNPRFSMQLGIGMVYQHFQLVEPFNVVENITLGNEFTSRSILLDEKKGREEVRKVSEKFGLSIDPDAIVEELPVGLKQRVEILKQLYRDAELLILDEPSAVLTPSEVEGLFKTMKNLRAAGKSLIFITHKLNEPLQVADRIVVMRGGKMVGETTPDKADKEKLAEMVVGEKIVKKLDRLKIKDPKIVLKVDNLFVRDEKVTENYLVEDVSLTTHTGEIVGIAGVQGNGQPELLETIMSLRPTHDGIITLNSNGESKDITHFSTINIIRNGVAYIPEDRSTSGLVLDLKLNENIWLGFHGNRKQAINYSKDLMPEEEQELDKSELKEDNLSPREKITHAYFLPTRVIDWMSSHIVDSFKVKTSSIFANIRSLSGGNQQKVLVGREFAKQPKLIIAAEPSRGVDIGVQTQIHEELIRMRNDGVSILLASSDLEEVLALSDHLLIAFDGKIVASGAIDSFTLSEISQYMTTGMIEEVSK
jgi:simple sugar transport system ATP-binding protein